MIYYLAQAYSNDPEEAIEKAHDWVLELRIRNYFVLSPILHTHYYHKNLQSKLRFKRIWEYMNEENYVTWDLAILDAVDKTQLTMLFAPTCFTDCNFKMPDCDESCGPHCDRFWASKGAQEEYKWAKRNNVRCLYYDSLIKGLERSV